MEDLSRAIDRVLEREVDRFRSTVPYADHLTDLDQPLHEDYYLRHRLETVRRIRSTARTDALALARMVDEDYAASRLWAEYVAEELGHDLLFLADLEAHGVTEDAVLATPPFPATQALIAFLEEQIALNGSLPAVTYSVFVEWNSERYSAVAVAKAERAYSERHVRGSKHHLGIDEGEDHYSTMVTIVRRLLTADPTRTSLFFEYLERFSGLFCDYFTELHRATIPQPAPS